MSKDVYNTLEIHIKSRMLYVLFISLFIISGAMTHIFGDYWSGNVKSIIVIFQLLLIILSGWFGLKMRRLSDIIKNDSQLLKQSKDERNVEIDYKSRARGFLGMITFLTVYLFIADFQRGLYRNTFLYDIKGFYIALMVFAVGGLVTVISMFFMDKE